MKILKIFIILVMLNSIAIPKELPHYNIEKNLIEVLHNANYDIESKSIKGWIRVFNSNDKLNDYDIYIRDRERLLYLSYFKNKLEKKQNKYKREIK